MSPLNPLSLVPCVVRGRARRSVSAAALFHKNRTGLALARIVWAKFRHWFRPLI